jgi:hypothetical protein
MNAAMGGLPAPAFFVTAANAFPANSNLTIAQMLTAFPQYSSLQDGWGGAYVDNFSYEAVQVTVRQRFAHGLNFNVNFTLSKNIGDDGTFRSGYALPAAAVDGHWQSWKMDRIDRSWTTVSAPRILNTYGSYQLPFGEGKIGGNSWLVRNLAGGWLISGVYTFNSGGPFTVTWGSGGNCANAAPNAGQCMPSLNPNYASNPRINGKYGSGPHGYQFANASNIKYVDINAFAQPANISTTSATAQYLIGNAPRTAAYGIRNPANQTDNASIRRSFPFPFFHEKANFVFQADASNFLNLMIWGSPTASWGAGSTTFGEVGAPGTSPRDWQMSGHVNF